MSNPFGSFTGTEMVIHQDGADNAANGLRRTKRTEILGKPPATKRPALGIITNTTRVQPSRAAKQGIVTEGLGLGLCENAQAKTKSAFAIPGGGVQTQSFSIHLDNGQSGVQNQIFNRNDRSHLTSIGTEKLQLNSVVTSLRPPLSTLSEPIVVEDDSTTLDSPMVLDVSVDLTKEDTEDTEEARFQRILVVPEYKEDIYQYLREHELRHRPKPGYMKKQPDITNSMRCILIDWLVEVAEEYKLHRETLCLAVNYIDRFLSHMSVLRGKLQLVGAASMFLAAKFEEIYPPDVGEFTFITDDTYTKKQILRMENLVLRVLAFDVAVPTVNCFCERFCEDMNADEQTKSLAMYLCELTLVEADPFLKYVPSVIAASAVCLANHTLNRQPWPAALADTKYTPAEFEACLQDLYSAFCRAPEHPQQAIREKYKQSSYQEVSLLCPPPTLPSFSVH